MFSTTFEANRKLVDQVAAIAAEKNATVAQVALAWIIAEGAVPIPGTRRSTRLDENAGAADILLSEEDRARLTEALPHDAIVGSRDGIDAEDGSDR